MAWTRWYSPKQARQLETNEIRVAAQGTQGISDFVSVFPVRSISTSFGTFIREETNALVFTRFGLPDVVPKGIELRLVTQRLARIQDKTIQLWDGSKQIGENKQNLLAENDQLYGGEQDRWGLESQYAIPLTSSDFGVVIDLQPHTEIPCSDTVYIKTLSIRIYI
jgi:hypothetical protein